jgi:ribonuclease HI
MYKLYFDGASRGNPGIASYGGVIYNEEDDEVLTYRKKMPRVATNNVAEYNAILAGLRHAVGLKIKELDVYGDSNLIIKQMNGEWKVKNERMKTFYNACKKLEKHFDIISYTHVYRENNKQADALANEALDK